MDGLSLSLSVSVSSSLQGSAHSAVRISAGFGRPVGRRETRLCAGEPP